MSSRLSKRCFSVARLASVTVIALLVPSLRASGQPRAPSFAHVDSVILGELRRTQTPGAAVALVSGDRVVYAKGFGRSAVEGGRPVTPQTLFRIASITKVFTAATLVALAEAGRIDLGAPIGQHLADLRDPLRRITAHQLLSHTSGLTMGPIPPGGSDPLTALAEATRQITAGAAFAPPREIFSYSNVGYLLAGRLIEVVARRAYAEQVRTALLAPLGMVATTFDSALAARAGVARGSVDARSGSGAAPLTGRAESWPFSGLYSNVLELSRFAVAFMHGGRHQGRQVLSPTVVSRLSAPFASFRSGEGDYGYGVRVYRHRGVDVVEHGGRGLDGYRSLLYMVPSRRVAVVVLANRAGRRPYAVVDAALEALLPGGLQPVIATPPAVPMQAAEMARYVGRYTNGMVIEVRVDDGVLTLNQGGASVPIRKLADGRFVAGGDDGASWVAFVSSADGTVGYLHFNMRAFRRL